MNQREEYTSNLTKIIQDSMLLMLKQQTKPEVFMQHF